MMILAHRGFRAVAFDQRGHGDSTGTASDLPEFADDAAAMIRAEPPPVVVVGASLGGLAAIAALADPALTQRVAGMVLVDVVPDPDPHRALPWLAGQGLLDHRRPLVEAILTHGPRLRSVLARVQIPLVLVRGGPSSPITDSDVDRLLALQPSTRVERIWDAGHLVARDNPHELGCIIADIAETWLAPPSAAPGGFNGMTVADL